MANILVADDHPLNLKVMKGMLVHLKCDPERIVTVTNGQSVLEFHRQSPCDLIFMDCHMPFLDGLQTTRAIRALEDRLGIEAPVPIVAFTADATMTGERIRAAGMNGLLVKPFSLADLNGVLDGYFPAIGRD